MNDLNAMDVEAVERPFYVRDGNWVTAGVTGLLFPRKATEIEFRGQKLILIPGHPQKDSRFGNFYPLVAFDMPSEMPFEEGQRFVASFLSSVAWARRIPIHAATWGGGNLPRPLGGRDAQIATDDRFALNYLPEPADDQTRMALAFYREGLSLNHVAYQCLSFFKILNLVIGDGKKQIAWINSNIEKARERGRYDLADWERKVGLNTSQQTAGQYLFVSNRCAIAHAQVGPVVDPDNPEDYRRLHQDLPIIQALAEHLIEAELGVKSAMTVYQEHLYELQGFKEMFGTALVNRILAGEEMSSDEFPTLPLMSVRLAFEEPFPPLIDMIPTVVDCADGSVGLQLTAPDGLTTLLLGLEFPAERLQFDFNLGCASEDDGSRSAALNRASLLRFQDRYLGNGSLEIWSQAKRISRKDAFLPENIDMNATYDNYQRMIAEADAIAERRA